MMMKFNIAPKLIKAALRETIAKFSQRCKASKEAKNAES
jgi:hypothetical protein